MKFIFLLLGFILYQTSISFAIELNTTKQSQPVFIQNIGQWNTEVIYLARIKGMDAWITKNGIRYDFHTTKFTQKEETNTVLSPKSTPPEGIVHGNVVDMICEGSKIPNDEPTCKQKTYYNYILGNDSSKWASYIPVFNEIVRKDVYKGIDQRLYFENGSMRYDFIVSPMGNTKDIVLNINGARGVSINSNGELVLKTSVGDVVQQKLYAYQMNGNEKQKVECSFEMKSNNRIGFKVAKYDKTKQIIIDPVLYCTFLGSSSIEQGDEILVDRDNNVIIFGRTAGTNFPATVGSYSIDFKGWWDVFVAKFTPDLSEMIFCTLFGGRYVDIATACALDINNNIEFCGYTSSNDLPHFGGEYDRTYNAETDAFVAKISTTGSNLQFSTFLGGAKVDHAFDIVNVPITDEIVVVGYTESTDFPTTQSVYKRVYGNPDGFVAKINKTGSTLVFSTFLGNNNSTEACLAVTLDRTNHPVVVGSTSSSFPTTTNAYRSTNSNLSTGDGFLATLGVNGNTLDYATLIGGDGLDYCSAVAVDRDGIAAVCGYTESQTGFNVNGYDKDFAGSSEGFVIRLGIGGGYYYSSYLGGSGRDEAKCIAYLDDKGAVVVGGTAGSGSADFPTGDVVDLPYKGVSEGYLLKLSPDGRTCKYFTYFGGSISDTLISFTQNSDGDFYITGATTSPDMPTTSKVKFKEFNGSQDAYIAVINTCSITAQPHVDTLVCAWKPLTLRNKMTGDGPISYNWVSDSKGVTVGNSDSLTIIPEEQGGYTLIATDKNCEKKIHYLVRTKSIPTIYTPIEEKKTCIGTSLQFSASTNPENKILWYDSLTATTPSGTGSIFTTKPILKSTVIYVEAQDTSTKCTSVRKAINVVIVPEPSAPTADNPSICGSSSVKLSTIFPSDANFKWYDSLVGGKLLHVGRDFTTPIITQTTTYYVESFDTTTNCVSNNRTPVIVNVLPSPNPIIQGQNAACVNSDEIEYSVAFNAKRDYKWTVTQNGTIKSGLNTNKIKVSWTAVGQGLISLSEKDQTSSCFKDVTYPVNVSDHLTSTIIETGSPNLCTGDSILLDAGAGYTNYKWSTGESTQRITVKTAGDYSVDVQDAGGCKGSSNKVTVTLNLKPNPKITGKNSTCVNGNPVQYSVTPVAANSYKWKVSPEGTIISGQDSPIVTVSWANTGTGNVKVIESSINCSSENVFPVVIGTSLVPLITVKGKTTLCEGESVLLDAGDFAKYKWSSGETSKVITVKTAGTYSVEVEDAAGCKGTSQPIIITMSPTPSPTIIPSGETYICEGDSVVLDAGTFISYIWSTGAATPKITVKTSGKYSVAVLNSNGCRGTSPEVTVTVNPMPLTPIITQAGEDSLVISPFDPSINYSWRLNGTDIGQTAQTIQANIEGSYTVVAVHATGCMRTSIPFQFLKPNSTTLTVSVSPILIEAAAGETIRIPLIITSSKNLIQASGSTFTAQISVEPSVLVPTNGVSTIESNRRIVSINGNLKTDNDTLAVVEMKSALGVTDSSSIVLKSMIFQNSKVQVTTKDGFFRLTGVCRDGGVRYYNSGSVLSVSIQPNPAAEVLNMTITPSESGKHTVTLTNALGEDVSVLFNSNINGSKEISSSVTDIPDGVYFLVVRSPSQVLTKRLLIAK